MIRQDVPLTSESRPIGTVVVDDLEISGVKVLVDGFNITSDGRVSLILKADEHVTLRYADGEVPSELRINMPKAAKS